MLDLRPVYDIQADNFRPLHDQVLVREIPRVSQIGSIIIPEEYQKGPDGDKFLARGVVVLCGPGDKCTTCGGSGEHPEEPDSCPMCSGTGHYPMYTNPGDIIIFDRPSNREIMLNGERLFVCHHEQHILAVLVADAHA